MTASEMDSLARAGDYVPCFYNNGTNCNAPQGDGFCDYFYNNGDKDKCLAGGGGCINCSKDQDTSSCMSGGSLYQSCDTRTVAGGCGDEQFNFRCGYDDKLKQCYCGDSYEDNMRPCDSSTVLGGTPCPR
jgi:hypothetical protein